MREVRPGRSADLPALTAIYDHYVVHDHATFDVEPFTVDQRRDWFARYGDGGLHRLLVAEDEGVVVGYATSGPWRSKPAYGGTVETTVYLHPEHMGRGHGKALYGELLGRLEAEPTAHTAVAGIAVPNPASIALHEAVGFRAVGRFAEVGHKFGRYVDVAWFQRPL